MTESILYTENSSLLYKYGFIFILWYENYHISLVAITTREVFIFTPPNENK